VTAGRLWPPATLYVSSANLVRSCWHDTSIGVRSAEAQTYAIGHIFELVWQQAEVVE
jgi:hypothetical protein